MSNRPEELIKKINKEGGNVIYVQGSVYSAMKAIRNIEAKNKIDFNTYMKDFLTSGNLTF